MFYISIHALLAESDVAILYLLSFVAYFYPRSPCGERRTNLDKFHKDLTFLSTLSLRRATPGRAPLSRVIGISIHALLAESDLGGMSDKLIGSVFLSTLSLRRATNRGSYHVKRHKISIHALLAESDHSRRSR